MSVGGQASESSQRSDSRIAESQLPFLTDLWQQAQAQTDPGAVQAAAARASGLTGPALEAALGSAQGLTNTKAQIEAQQGSLQAGLGQMFREEIMPGIQGGAIGAGGFGGGRQGVAEGQAVGQLGQAFTQGMGDIVANANRTALGAAGMIPGLSDAVYQNATAPSMAGFDPLSRFAAILGGPTVLQRSRGSSQSGGFSLGIPFM